jgi:Uma2 family endonuclease
MSDSAKQDRPASFEDLANLPEGIVGQIIDGVLYTHPRPAGKHAYAATKINSAVDSFFGSRSGGGPGGWIFLFEPQLHLLQKHDVIPDIAGWKEELLSDDQIAELSGARITISPHWVCEVLSPSSVRMDKVLKSIKYAEAAIEHYWLIDPEQKTLEVRKLEKQKWLISASFEGSEKVRAEPFEAVEIDLGNLWGPVRH